MSRAYALVKFDRDDEVVIGCYNGTCDILGPHLITWEDLKSKYDGMVFDWDDTDKTAIWIDPDTITDSEPCEIYIDYGGGFVWRDCTASRSKMMITSNLADWDNDDHYHIPDWVYRYFKDRGWSTKHFEDRVVIDAVVRPAE